MFNVISAAIIPTRPTFAISRPFATSWVPTSISVFPLLKLLSMRSASPFFLAVSRSSLATDASGNVSFVISSTFSVPMPK